MAFFLSLQARALHDCGEASAKAIQNSMLPATMLRSTATRSLLKSWAKAPTARPSYSAASSKFRNVKILQQSSNRRPQVLQPLVARPTTISLLYATKAGPPKPEPPKPEPPFDHVDLKAEDKFAHETLHAHPEQVSTGSSVRHVFEHGQARQTDDPEMLAGIKADLHTIKDTFALTDVPRESLYIGAAGVLPYAATSLSTVYLAYDINHAHLHGQGYIFSPETAHQLLDLVTPIQIGYGAVVSIDN